MASFFTYKERLDLHKYLKESRSFKEIGRRLGKNPTTISREVRKHLSEVATGYPGFSYNACKNRFNCRKKGLCNKECTRPSSAYCKLCQKCNDNCPDFIEEICTARFRVPYVCNSCEQIARLNAIISPLVQQGQSIHQIYVSHENELMCSEKTIYNYIDACLLDVRNIDLPRKVKFRERYKKPAFKVDKGCRIGRNYEAFENFIETHPDTAIVQEAISCHSDRQRQ